MSKFTVEFSTDSAAFVDGDGVVDPQAIAETLRVVAGKVAAHEHVSGLVRDANGNTVGSFEFSESD